MKDFRSSWRNLCSIAVMTFAMLAFAAPAPVMAQGVVGLEGIVDENSEFLFGSSNSVFVNTLTLGLTSGGPATVSTASSPISGPVNQGWWSGASNFNNDTLNPNYICGDLSNNGTVILNNFFTFDISGLQGQTVTTAQFNVMRAFGVSSTGRTFQTYSIFDVSTSAAVLNNNSGFNATIHLDLASGVNYGNFDISLPIDVDGSFFEILQLTLNANAISDINSAISDGSQFFSIGGTLFPMGNDSDGDGVVDALDACPGSDLSPTIVIDGIDTGVENELLADGCTLADLIDTLVTDDPASVDVVEFLVDLKAEGFITGQDLGSILKALNSP